MRKLGAPGNPEFALGALVTGGRMVVNDDVVRGLGLTAEHVRGIAHAEARETGGRRELAPLQRRRMVSGDITGATSGCANCSRLRTWPITAGMPVRVRGRLQQLRGRATLRRGTRKEAADPGGVSG